MSDFQADFNSFKSEKEPKSVTEYSHVSNKFEDDVSDLYPIYWIRILKILTERDEFEQQYKVNPHHFEGLGNNHAYPNSDLAYHGIRITEFTKELSKIVTNQNLKSTDFKALLEEMMQPDSPYVNFQNDEKGYARYFITTLGKAAYKKTQNDEILTGFWSIIDRTQRPTRLLKKSEKKKIRR